jgi:small subunit ribosomal protein S4
MGDPRRLKKKWSKPMHPWQEQRMIAESALVKEYGLKRKKEIWKVNSLLKRYFGQAKTLIGSEKATTEEDNRQFIRKLASLGVLKSTSKVDDALNLSLKDLMERRLQTLVVRKNLARNMLQARQFIVHEHIAVGNKKITVPSYMVSVEEEPLVRFADDSQLKDPTHPEMSVKPSEKKSRPKPEARERFGRRRREVRA